jgi:uncharacterized phage protein gp47/JayE
MAFFRPTFQQILTRVQADINGRLPGADALLRRSVLNVIAYMIAGIAHTLYGALDYWSRQIFPDTAEEENLNRWGRFWSVTRKAATKATGNITATGVNGSPIDSGTQVQRSDGALFVTTESATIASGTATIPVQASDFGQAGNTAATSKLNFVSPPNGVNAEAVVASGGLTGGADTESNANYLVRILRRIDLPPHGGAAFDYVTWALEVPGVTRAWCPDQEEPVPYVVVRFMMDDTYPDGIPEPDDVTRVADYINEPYRRPVTAKLIVLAPVAVELDFEIQLTSNDTTETRDAVEAELRDMLLRDGEPGGTIYLSRINAAISSASGQFDHILTDPVANVTHDTGEIPVFGEITWIPAP